MSVQQDFFHGYLHPAFAVTFREEWEQLEYGHAELVQDFLLTADEDCTCTIRQYADRIGRDNLASYVDCLLASRDSTPFED